MNEREFCYWLQGLFEVGGVKALDEAQTQIVKDHLALVFKKVTYAALGVQPNGAIVPRGDAFTIDRYAQTARGVHPVPRANIATC